MVASDIPLGPSPCVATPSKCSDGELQDVLQNVSLNESRRDGSSGVTLVAKRFRPREVASRYKTSTISSANAAALTAQRYQSPSRGRSPSPNLNRTRTLPIDQPALQRAISADRRPASVERRRPWPASASENKTPASTTFETTKAFSSKKLAGRDGLWPSINSLSSSIQSDISISSTNGVTEGLPEQQPEVLNRNLSQNGRVNGSLHSKTNERRVTPERRRTPLRRAQNATEQTKNPRSLVENVPSKNDHSSIPIMNQNSSLNADHNVRSETDSKAGSNVDQTLVANHRFASTLDKKSGSRLSQNLNSSVDHNFGASCRWPGSGNGKSLLSRSVDLGVEKRSPVCGTLSLARSASKLEKNGKKLLSSMHEGIANPKVVRHTYNEPKEERASQSDGFSEEASSMWEVDSEAGSKSSLTRANSLDDNGSDTESSSSGGISVVSAGSFKVRGTVVPARFWQDANRRLKVSYTARSLTPLRTSQSGSSTSQSPLSPSSKARSIQCSSPLRNWGSPTRTRSVKPVLTSHLSLNGRHGNALGLLNLSMDSRKNKKTPGQQEEGQDLRLLHNRWLQWCFVNARAEQALETRTAAAEALLYKVFSKTCELRVSVAAKQAQRHEIRQALKLKSVLETHAAQLEAWESLQLEHSSALTGVMKALEAAIIRVPLVGGSKIDIQETKQVLSSASEIMNTVDGSVRRFLSKQAEVTDSLLSELAKTIILEKACLQESGELLARVATLETEERSLRTFLIQLESERIQSSDTQRTKFANSVLVC